MANGFHQKPRKKAINPIEKTTFRSDQLANETLKEDAQRTKTYGPKGHSRPIAGTNGSFK